jgi:hypothetical protein
MLLIYSCIIYSYFVFSFIKTYEFDVRLAAVDDLQWHRNSMKHVTCITYTSVWRRKCKDLWRNKTANDQRRAFLIKFVSLRGITGNIAKTHSESTRFESLPAIGFRIFPQPTHITYDMPGALITALLQIFLLQPDKYIWDLVSSQWQLSILLSSRTWRHVIWQNVTDISEEPAASNVEARLTVLWVHLSSHTSICARHYL